MDSARYVIVGAGVAGTAAATAIRQHDDEGSVLLIGQEAHPLYSRPSLAGYMRDEHSKESLFLRDITYYRHHHIETMLGCKVAELNSSQKTISLDGGSTIAYEKLLIATGSRPRSIKLPGSDLRGIYSLRTIEDAELLKQRVIKAKHVLVVGGGFITLEMIQFLAKAGVATTVLIRGDYYWQNVLDRDSGLLIDRLISQSPNITVLYQTRVEAFAGEEMVEAAVLSNGRRLKTDLVLANIGNDYNTEWLEGSGLTIERGVVVNQYLQTDEPDIFAAGDIANFYDPLLGIYHQVGNWNNASMHGQVAGQNMTGHLAEITAVTSYSINFMGKDISFIGQTSVRPAITAIPRGSHRSGSYGRLLMKNNRLIGATLINRFQEREPISRLISSQLPVNEFLADLTDESIPLAKLVDQIGA